MVKGGQVQTKRKRKISIPSLNPTPTLIRRLDQRQTDIIFPQNSHPQATNLQTKSQVSRIQGAMATIDQLTAIELQDKKKRGNLKRGPS
jgi:hypothetical protein